MRSPKGRLELRWMGKDLALIPAEDGKYDYEWVDPDDDPLGPWFDSNPLNSPNPRKNLRFTVTSPTGHVIQPPPNGWRWSPETLQEKIASGEIRFTADGTGIRRRTYLRDHAGLPPSTLWTSLDMTGHTRQAKSELKALFPGQPTAELFATPKPERLMHRLIALTTHDGDLVLDCFGGSGTTAAVAHKMRRRWLTVELLERNVDRFTLSRLIKVVEGGDTGGISSVTGRRSGDRAARRCEASGRPTVHRDAVEVHGRRTVGHRHPLGDDEVRPRPGGVAGVAALVRRIEGSPRATAEGEQGIRRWHRRRRHAAGADTASREGQDAR